MFVCDVTSHPLPAIPLPFPAAAVHRVYLAIALQRCEVRMLTAGLLISAAV